MKRRAFSLTILGAAAALVPGRLGLIGRSAEPLVNGARLLERLRGLAQVGMMEGGVNRVAYSDADLAGRAYARRWMQAAGLATSVDAAGNLIGRRAGAVAGLPPLMFGSHIDSVPDGGNYDGPVGALGAVEVAHTIVDGGIVTRHPLEVVIFQNEEGGKTGSRVLSGEMAPEELDLVTRSGKTIREGIAFVGGDPARLSEARRPRGAVAAYLELHVEQGAVLERREIDVGVVEGIVGITRWSVEVEGSANHAGTTPMDRRQDSLLAAARFVDAVHRTVRGVAGSQVGTVGRIEAFPGAPNVVPGRTTMTLELRDLSMPKIEMLFERIRGEANRIGQASGTTFRFSRFYVSGAAPTDERLRGVIEAAAAGLGLSTLRMPSGAGHDAQSVAQFAPVGMIFIPSVGGISHSPQEYSRPEQIVAGANVLLRSVLAADRASWGS